MKELEAQQRGVLDLIKGRSVSPDDPYLRCVANSHGLAVLREIAIWWRALQLEARCRFTSRLLKRLGIFHKLVEDYFDNNAIPPFVEDLSRDFLSLLSAHTDPLVLSVSQFERGFLEARAGSAEAFEVLWDRHPDIVLRALEEGTEIPGPEIERVYCMRIDRNLPRLCACTCARRDSDDSSGGIQTFNQNA
jgi:hypothetical protein